PPGPRRARRPRRRGRVHRPAARDQRRRPRPAAVAGRPRRAPRRGRVRRLAHPDRDEEGQAGAHPVGARRAGGRRPGPPRRVRGDVHDRPQGDGGRQARPRPGGVRGRRRRSAGARQGGDDRWRRGERAAGVRRRGRRGRGARPPGQGRADLRGRRGPAIGLTVSGYVLLHSPLVGPLTWRGVADELAGRGHDVWLPALRDAFTAGPPYYPALAAAVAAQVDPGAGGATLVAHSGAGALVPAVVQALRRPVTAAVFVDALLPHGGRGWLDTAPDELAD